MQDFDGGAGGFELGLGGGESAEGSGFEGVAAAHAHAAGVFAFGAKAGYDYAGWGEEFVGGVPDEIDDICEEGDAAVDVVLCLPETWGFPGDFEEGCHGHSGEGFLGFGGEVVFDVGEDGDGKGADAEVGGEGLRCAGFCVGDGDVVVGGGDLGDGRVVVDHVGGEGAGEAVWDAVHAADGLEHGGLPVDLLFVEFAAGEVGCDELGEFEGLVQGGLCETCSARHDEAGARCADVFALLVEVAEGGEEVEEVGGVFFGELVVEGVLVDGFGEEFGEVASGVVDDLTLLDGLAAVEDGVLHEGGAGGVDFDFEGYAEIVTVVEEIGVDGGDASGAGVEVAAILPGAGLDGAVGELDFAAVADGPGAAAGAMAGFDDGAVEAGFAKLVCGDEASDACAEDDDLFAFAEVGGELGKDGGFGSRQEAEGLHGGERSGIAADLGHALYECTTGETHREDSAL